MRSESSPIGLKQVSFIEEARRRQIIEAAIEAIAAEGYAGASLAKLAARAKISKSVISYHFAGKDELLEETIRQLYRELWGVVQPRFLAAKTASEQLRAYIETEFAYLQEHRAQLLTISYILNNHRNAKGELYLLHEAHQVNLTTLGKMLEAGQKSGEFRAFAIRPMAVTLMQSINGALEQWVTDPTLSLADYARELITIFDLATRNESASPKHKVSRP